MKTEQKNALSDCVLKGRRAFFRSASAHSPLPGALFEETSQGAIYYCSGMNYAPCNGVMGRGEDSAPTEEEIKNAIAFFSERNLPFIWWSPAKILEGHGFQYAGILTGIALDLSDSIPVFSPQVKTEVVQTESNLKIFSDLVADVFGINKEQFLPINSVAMKRGEQLHFLAYSNGNPVGAATLSTNEDSAGIWNLATLPEYRKAGVGQALVYAALLEAKKRQYKQVMAILMPKGMAWGLFARLGFVETCAFPFYIYGASAENLES